MRVTLIVVAIALSASPSYASKSCMTQAEARAALARCICIGMAEPLLGRDARSAPAGPAQQTREQRRVVRRRPSRKPAPGAFHSKWREALSRCCRKIPAHAASVDALGHRDVRCAPPRINWQERCGGRAHIPPIVDRSEPAEISSPRAKQSLRHACPRIAGAGVRADARDRRDREPGHDPRMAKIARRMPMPSCASR